MTDSRLRAACEQLLRELNKTLYGDQQEFDELNLIEAFARRQRQGALRLLTPYLQHRHGGNGCVDGCVCGLLRARADADPHETRGSE